MAHIDLRSSPQDGSDSTGSRAEGASLEELTTATPSPRVAAGPPSTTAPGISLAEVLARARLTPAQTAALVGDALEHLADGWVAGCSPRLTDLRRTGLDPTGRLEITFATPPVPPDPVPHRRDIAALGRFVSELLAATSQPIEPHGASAELLVLLHRATRLRDEPAVTRLADELRRTLAEPDAGHPRAELAALFDRLADRPAEPATAAPAPRLGRRRTSNRVRPAASPVPLRSPHPVWAGLFRSVALLLILVIVLGAEYAFLGDRILRDLHRLAPQSSAGAPAATSHAAAASRLRTVPTLGPAAAGAVNAVDLRTLRPCHPGRACEVRLLVSLRRHARPMTAHWSFTVFDRCTGATVQRPGGHAQVAAGRRQITLLDRVALPHGRALALLAVTSAPAHAVAPALPVPATGGTCPAG